MRHPQRKEPKHSAKGRWRDAEHQHADPCADLSDFFPPVEFDYEIGDLNRADEERQQQDNENHFHGSVSRRNSRGYFPHAASRYLTKPSVHRPKTNYL